MLMLEKREMLDLKVSVDMKEQPEIPEMERLTPFRDDRLLRRLGLAAAREDLFLGSSTSSSKSLGSSYSSCSADPGSPRWLLCMYASSWRRYSSIVISPSSVKALSSAMATSTAPVSSSVDDGTASGE